MQKGLMMVKDEMGPQAVILETRNVKVGGFLGLFAKKMVEIVAASDYPEELEKVKNDKMPTQTYSVPSLDTRYHTPVFKSKKLQNLYNLLIKNDIDKAFSASLVGDIERGLPVDLLEDKDAIGEKLSEKLGGLIPFSGSINIGDEKNVIFFVGPTGVGKTTTIAKIAALFTLNERKKVSLVSIDTFRIAAVEQLRTYADILNIPFNVVFTPLELSRVIKSQEKADLILIDTAGRSPKNEIRMSELKGFVKGIFKKKVYLVLSINTRLIDLKDTVERFFTLGVDSIIFTKLDESEFFLGNIINLTREYKVPISYITFGQNVPDDIDIASIDNILKRCMYEYYWRSGRETKANSNW